jgi:hypothetical protein
MKTEFLEKSEPSLCVVCSSHGVLAINTITGEVVSMNLEEPDSEEGKDLASIARFDVEEWKGKYQKPELPKSIDILDLGYWYGSNPEQYEEPAHDWRIEAAEMRKENNGETYNLINF